MLKDITLGQYFPGNSPIHRLDPRFKLVLMFLYIIMLFSESSFLGFFLLFCFALYVVLASKINLSMILKGLKPLVFVILFVSILNLFYTQGQSVFPGIWLLENITVEGIFMTLSMVTRIILLLSVTTMLTYTTSPIVLTDGIERLLRPLKRIGLPVHELAMMMTIALRFIPVLIDETGKIMDSQKARGADFESGRLLRRVKAMIPILVPLFVSAFRRADELAVAMESRCYRGDIGRTRLHELKAVRLDHLALVYSVAFFALVAAARLIPFSALIGQIF